MRWLVAGMAALALAGCAHTPRPTPPPIEHAAAESISYETGPCFGSCPVYRVVVGSDGSGTFTGIRNTAVAGTHPFSATPSQYVAFAAALAPFRPRTADRVIQPGNPGCEQQATDLPSVDVRWTGTDRESRRLYFYYGCNMDKNRTMAEALGNAPDALPIGDLIGERP